MKGTGTHGARDGTQETDWSYTSHASYCLQGPSARSCRNAIQKRSIEHFGPMLRSYFFSYSYSASRYSYSIDPSDT
ncbi:MAG: hypothetical protein ACK55Z_00045, partial [bacterium]